MIDMDQVEDFYEALSAAIESGLDTPGAHAVSDMYRAAIARAEAAEARADEMEVDRDNWKARADAAEYEVMARPGIDKQFQTLNDELIAIRAQLAALQAAGEWRPVSETPLEDGRYLVWWWSDEWFIAQYSTAMNTWLYDDDDDPMNPTPTYWQPLPTPPEGTP